jgi:lipoate-protein ligase A
MPEAFQGIMRAKFRLIVDPPGPGAWNMAVDETLLETAGESDAPAILRLYAFSPTTLSVGRFQRTAGVFDFERLSDDGVSFVRRPSGGQAVLHAEELTYSVAVGRHFLDLDESAGATGKRLLYRSVVPVLLAGLQKLSIRARESAALTPSRDPDCFAAAGEYEIDGEQGQKLIGSAQMVTRTAVLQHGSIPLSKANRRIYRYLMSEGGENASTSVSEELGREVTFEQAREAFRQAVVEKLLVEDSVLSAAEAERAARLERDRYGQDSWNQKY